MANVLLDAARTLFDALVLSADGDSLADFDNRKRFTGCTVRVTIASFVAGSMLPSIEAYDVTTGAWYPLLVGTAMTANGTQTLTLDPRITAVANSIAQVGMPLKMRLKVASTLTPDAALSATVDFTQ